MEYAKNPRTTTLMLEPWHQQLHNCPDTTWYIPVCHQQIHWIVLELNPHNHTNKQYNILKTLSTQDYKQYIKPFLEEQDEHRWQTTHPETQQQINRYDCGTYVIAEFHRQKHQQPYHPRHLPHQEAIQQTIIGYTTRTFYKDAWDASAILQNVPKQAKLTENTAPLTLTTLTSTPNKQTSRRRNQKQATPGPETLPPVITAEHLTRVLQNEKHFGNKLQKKSKNSIRIYSQNIQGIPMTNTEEHFHAMLDMMTDRKVDIFGWSETNFEWHNYTLNAKLFSRYKTYFPKGKWNPIIITH